MSPLEVTQIDPIDFDVHLKITQESVAYQHVYAALKYYKDGYLEGVKLSIFQAVSGHHRLYCILHEIFEESLKVLINTDSRDEDFVRTATLAAMDKVYPILSKYDSFYCAYIRQDIRDIMFSHAQSLASHPFRPMDEPNICYYVNDQQWRLLEKQDIQLPDDYYWVNLTEKDAQQICAEQIYTSRTDEKFVALRIRNFPAVGTAYKPLGDLAEAPGNVACYEYTDGLGVISLLYCQKAHRGRRLATLVEQKICQRNIIEQEIRPYKGVSIHRPRVVQMTAKNKLWTAITDEDQNEELYYCSLYCREDRPKVVIYED